MFDIIAWYLDYKRDLPWRDTNDPYKIWLSEIILQQTRVEQGLAYYNKFIAKYPSVFDLANANIDEVLILWQGLGYYSRARNLHETAIKICNTYSGMFPANYDELIKLKGIGDYTASAIASIAFGLPEAVVDGNVYRVLSRFFADSTAIDSPEGKKRFKAYALELLNSNKPGLHNEAIMELGATVCMPKNPSCSLCPVQQSCAAYEQKSVLSFPVKSKRVKQKSRHFYFMVLKYQNTIYICKRIEQDIWKGLYQFPLIEQNNLVIPEKIDNLVKKLIPIRYSIKKISDEYKHVLSHQIIYARFVHIEMHAPLENTEWQLIPVQNLKKFALPRIITRYLENNAV